LRKYRIEFYALRNEYLEVRYYFEKLPLDVILSGLRFSNSRYVATIGGYLNPGRKSIVKMETSLLTKKQARVRLKNWKMLVKKYREKGYSYPTIYRIKVQLERILID
jgi:hypothetical protein